MFVINYDFFTAGFFEGGSTIKEYYFGEKKKNNLLYVLGLIWT